MITKENLGLIEEAENYLRSLGFEQLRVRTHGRLARVELLKEDIILALNIREEIVKKLKSIGFGYITLDLEGFRSGSMNKILEKVGT